MKRNSVVFFIGVCFILHGCKQSPVSTVDLHVIDLDQSSFPKCIEDNYNEFVRYIPLETNKDVLIEQSSRLVYFSEERIIMINNRQGDVFVFDGNGKILSFFNRMGSGPEEYKKLLSSEVIYDPFNREIFVMEREHCHVYSENGNYLRDLLYPRRKEYTEAYSFDKETLLVFDANTLTDSAFVLISKKDGKILSCINLHLKNRISNQLVVSREGNRVNIRIGVQKQQLIKDGENFILAEISSDTIYKFTKDRQLIPLLTRKPSVHEYGDNNPFKVFQPIKVTDKIIFGFFYKQNLLNPERPESFSLLYDLDKHQPFDFSSSMEEDFIGGFSSRERTDLPANLFVLRNFPDLILERIEDGKLQGQKIKELAKNLKDEDNPVIQVIRFK